MAYLQSSEPIAYECVGLSIHFQYIVYPVQTNNVFQN